MTTRPRSETPNELVLLEHRLSKNKRETHPDASDDEYFLISSIDTVMRERSLSANDIDEGITEGADDGGMDAVFTFEDRVLSVETEDDEQQGASSIELEIVQAKNEKGFSEVALQKLIDHLPLLLQLEPCPELATEFNSRVLERFEIFRQAVLRASQDFPTISVRIHYVTKAIERANEKVNHKSTRLAKRINECFPEAEVRIDMVGASRLRALAHERTPSTLELRYSEGPISPERGGSVCLVGLRDYYDFIREDDGRLRGELFQDNVRDYEGANIVNRAIADTLRAGDSDPTDFWWLNNGVTIIGQKVQPSNKKMIIRDPQIVNGLQTSRMIHQHFTMLATVADGAPDREMDNSRCLLVRVVQAEDDAVASEIIKATNSQTSIPPSSLHATEKVHRDIEQYLKSFGLYYDRRKNFYKNEGKGVDKIISIPYLAQAVMAVALQRPDSARARPSSLLKDDNTYKMVFSEDHALQLYAVCVLMMKRVDAHLRLEAIGLNRKDQTNLRFYVAMLAAFGLAEGKPLKPKVVAALVLEKLTDADLNQALTRAQKGYAELGSSDQAAKGSDLVKLLKPESFKAAAEAGDKK